MAVQPYWLENRYRGRYHTSREIAARGGALRRLAPGRGRFLVRELLTQCRGRRFESGPSYAHGMREP